MKYSDVEYRTNRQIVLARDNFRCRYCGSRNKINTHHIRPLSKGGNHEIYNLITLCKECHVGDHAEINKFGLSSIPGPEFEPYRSYLTNQDDANKYRAHLLEIGITPEF